MAAYQYIYVMKGLGKTYPGGREVLKDIWLSFLPGAKIGVLGPNGAGKSTLLRIMAGEERDFVGEAWAAEGVRVGYLPQEPALDPSKDVFGNVVGGLAEVKALLDRFEAVSARFADDLSPAEMEALIAEQGELQEKIDQADGWDLDRTVEIAMDALRCPPGDAEVVTLVGRRAASGGAVPASAAAARPAAARRADQPSRRRVGRLAAALSRGLSGHRRDRHPRPLFSRRGGRLDPRARSRSGHPVRGQLLGWLEQKQRRLEQEGRQEEARRRTLERELEWVRQSPRARQAKSKARLSAYEALVAQSREKAPETAQIVLPPGPRLGDLVIEARHAHKGFGDRLLIEALDFRLPPGGIVGVDRPERRGQDDALSHDHRTGDAGRRRLPDRRHRRARLCRSEPRHSRRDQHGVAGDLGRAGRNRSGAAQDGEPRLLRACSTSAAPTSRRRSASSQAASATVSTSRRC